ncbi:nucleotidyltransferase domain-containing protein [Candidatus Bipolaricaulota bacterium]|nr:nucleotidyltransferase domain-containing protein [Candidatus Bipolaricaulota bacterium]
MGAAEGKETEGLTALLARAEQDPEVLAVIRFGSRARGEDIPDSDIDICLVLEPRSYSDLELSKKKLDYLAEFDLDIHIYQQLPLYIRHRVLKEGKVLFCRDEDVLYDLAFRTIREYEDFKHIYREYLEEIARG